MVSIERLKARLNITDSHDDSEIERVARATESLVSQWLGNDREHLAKEHIQLGIEMLAARLFLRRNSPGGLEQMTELGPVYVSRSDGDIAQLLGLGAYRRAVVA
ncbi:phage head-tail connector protein [Corynebacterium striatum]|uniref:phage head-tail connector protein n=1 Tax=Corynebacterium striatum TaxID=43770 RepID=UPI00191E64C1|nr:phage head-tail connector protein [Corynebacterium striatum]EGT5591768.1 hypothetical protein [Corynebacterium striatum]QQU79117.1 phage head-tail connector protein [Corynebacterium striatum]